MQISIILLRSAIEIALYYTSCGCSHNEKTKKCNNLGRESEASFSILEYV